MEDFSVQYSGGCKNKDYLYFNPVTKYNKVNIADQKFAIIISLSVPLFNIIIMTTSCLRLLGIWKYLS